LASAIIARNLVFEVIEESNRVHKKRVCGEWFGLNANDLMVISNCPFEKMEVTEQENLKK
jgi:proteasome lid subunit RPN8/RPN11